jgi:hypothetical protein
MIPTLTKEGNNMALQTKKSDAKKSTEKGSVNLTINGEFYELKIGKVFAKHGSIVLK